MSPELAAYVSAVMSNSLASNPLYGNRAGRLNEIGRRREIDRAVKHRRAVRADLQRRKAGFAEAWDYGSIPRSRYFTGSRYRRYCWTTERYEGKFVSFVLRPVGPGAASNQSDRYQVIRSSVRFHALRRDARSRAEDDSARSYLVRRQPR
mgnify:CR=1 FL=1